ncbi:tetraprenyl-beta-curcumene synthase family protein [Radiobacillus deserti]|uniref:Tetraprenyl-beta-curcumene synthase family protein n=2 Tax=Radiobacillus deserti TaxID=2594883 RepID=A0A516KLB4_9BACI|nr:tetraprenyl-beta-curcumene synthase family protein [Radiobacillus deserti]
MRIVFQDIFPVVDQELRYWEKRAKQIPNVELSNQAQASIATKRFHCQGGAVFSLLAGKMWKEAITFIVAYQTISDYLDNLCDRSTSLDPEDFALLHQSMADALSPDHKVQNYYALREEQEDADYLVDLVTTCQKSLAKISNLSTIQPFLLELETLYSDLQVHKHVKIEERIPRLEKWFHEEKEKLPELHWYEFSACSGSTLGIFCLVSYAMGGKMTSKLADSVFKSYFPYMQGLHILLDYYIDQEEDKQEGDLNFCNYYESLENMETRFLHFIKETNKHVQSLPDKQFHEMVHTGLVGLYLADPKVKKLASGKKMTKRLLRASGLRSSFFHYNVKMYNKIKMRTIG